MNRLSPLNNLSPLGGVVNSTQQFCSYDLNGTDAYINYGDILNSVLTGVNKTFTITAIVKRGSVGTNQYIFSKWNGGDNNRSFAVQFLAANTIQVLFSNNGSAATDYNVTTATFTNTTDFYMISVKADMSVGDWSSVKVNINGIDSPFSSPSGSIGKTIYAGDAEVRLGAVESGGGSLIRFFDGLFNDIAVYNTYVSDGDLLARYNGGNILGAETISGMVWGSNFNNDAWNGSEYDVIDNVGSDDGITVNVLENEKLCVSV